MLRFVLKFGITGVALFFIARHIPGITLAGWQPLLIAMLAFGLINSIIKPIFALLTLPLTILTLGLFSFFLNIGFFALVAFLVEGFEIEGFMPALIGALLLSFASGVANKLL